MTPKLKERLLLNSANVRKIENYTRQVSQERKDAIARWYSEGGEWFFAWAKENYRMWNGEALQWNDPYLHEVYSLFGNPWIQDTFIEKSAQCGFSEMCIALTAFGLSELSIPVAFGLEARDKRDKLVGSRIQTAFEYIESLKKHSDRYHKATGKEDINSKSQITVGGVESTFFYSSTSGKGGSQVRQASSSLSSFTCYLLVADEIELWSNGTIEIAKKRQQASYLPTKPFRAGSTPGHEGGTLDNQIKQCRYLFQWKIECDRCQSPQYLDAFGNLLKPVDVTEDGTTEERFLDSVGRPLEWFHKDGSSFQSRIATAYVGCQHCAEELSKEAIARGRFVCRNTGLSLKTLCEAAVREQEAIVDGVALRLPRLASSLFRASETIRSLVKSRNPADEIQQGLGKCVSVGAGKIGLSRLMACVGMPLPVAIARTKPDLVVMGLDQGRASNPAVIQHWYLPDVDDPEQRWAEARKQTIWYGEVIGFEGCDRLIEQYGVDLVGMDLKPEVQLAGAYARRHTPRNGIKGQVILFDQVALKGEDFRRTTRNIQDVEVPVYALHRTFGLDAVRNRIYRKLHHLPAGLAYEPSDDRNFLLQFTTSDRTPDGRWVEPQGQPDHYMHADNFAEMVVLCSFYDPAIARRITKSPAIVEAGMNEAPPWQGDVSGWRAKDIFS